MDSKKASIEKEYMMLREEIMHEIKQRDNIAQFAYTITIAVFAAALSSNISCIVLCTLPFLLFTSLKVAECCYSISYIATYLSTHLEPQLDFEWENNHLNYYKVNKRKQTDRIIYMCSRLDFSFLTAISAFLFWHMRGYNFRIQNSLICGIILIILQIGLFYFELYIGIVYSNIFELKKNKLIKWEKVKKCKKQM